MRNFREICLVMIAVVGTVSFAGAAEKGRGPNTEVVGGSWQHHSVTFYYFGLTTRYSCSALEDHVKAILVHFGARKDTEVLAHGCLGGDVPSSNAYVDADFYTLAPAADNSGADTVQAYWTNREIQPAHPYLLNDGDCELVRAMKDTISKSFALKDLKYDTSCVRYQLNLNDFHVKANALIAVPVPQG
jgi:hypothetical protein